MKFKNIGWLCCVILCWAACSNPTPKVERAFYHWKTGFSPTAFESQRMQELSIGRLYIKYFDVDWPDDATQAQPQARVDIASIPTQSITPTVFITNRAIHKTGEANSAALADKIYRLIFSLHPDTLPPPREVQIDCDWTEGTRAAYFALLGRLHQQLDSTHILLSATIRLHQLKYPKQTGVPPVDRGMLMFYNMGDLDNPQENNSILDVAEGKRYLGNLAHYALPLDVALPIFAWGVLIRQGKPIQLLNNLRLASSEEMPWFSKVSENQMRVDSSHYFWGHYLYAGDEIRFEEVSEEALMASARLLADGLPSGERSVSLYHLDSLTLAHYERLVLDSVFRLFE